MKPLGTAAIFAVVGAWLIREIIVRTLSAQALQNEIRYRGVFEQQMTVIIETYSRLVIFQRDVRSLTAVLDSGELSKAEKGKIARKSWEDFSDYFYPLRFSSLSLLSRRPRSLQTSSSMWRINSIFRN